LTRHDNPLFDHDYKLTTWSNCREITTPEKIERINRTDRK